MAGASKHEKNTSQNRKYIKPLARGTSLRLFHDSIGRDRGGIRMNPETADGGKKIKRQRKKTGTKRSEKKLDEEGGTTSAVRCV